MPSDTRGMSRRQRTAYLDARQAERAEIERTFIRALRARWVASSWRYGVLSARSDQG